MENPFKFGSVVDGDFFTDREKEFSDISQILESQNHLIMIAPRRYGKTSLIAKIVKTLDKPTIWIDLQLCTSTTDFASQLLRQIFKNYPFEKIKFLIKNFRIIPNLSLNPLNNNVEISFQPSIDHFTPLEDVLNLIDELGKDTKKPIVVIDEFQDINKIKKGLDKKLRAVIQLHKNCNYVFLGSIESMMREIFEKKKSPFYHFGMLYTLNKISYLDFKQFLMERFEKNQEEIADGILQFTKQHPYYTQQLAFFTWMYLEQNSYSDETIQNIINDIIKIHNYDFERIWLNMNNTDKKILIGLATDNLSPLQSDFGKKNEITSTSTVFSGLKRLISIGIIIKSDNYEFDDPFFKQWLLNRRQG